MNKNIKLSEMIKVLQADLDANGEREVTSIGTSSGSNSSFIFHTKDSDNEGKDIYVKCYAKKGVK